MNSDLLAAIRGYVMTLEEEGIDVRERLSVAAVLSDLLTLAGIPADDWPLDVARAVDAVAPLPAA